MGFFLFFGLIPFPSIFFYILVRGFIGGPLFGGFVWRGFFSVPFFFWDFFSVKVP